MSRASLILGLVSTLCALLVVRPQNGFGTAVTSVDISYALENQPYTLHQPVVLTFKASNSQPNAIVLDLGQNRENGFAFHLLRPDGTAADSPSFTREGIAMIGRVVLRSGESLSQKLILNDETGAR
jgi:hypothetical protein